MVTIKKYVDELHETLDKLPLELIEEVIALLKDSRMQNRQVFVMGNGGSASTASHFAADLGKNTRCENTPDFRVMCLSDNVAALSAYSNDEGYENSFTGQLASHIRPNDVVIGISTSGNSANVLKAIELANRTGARTVGLTGFDGGKLGKLVEFHLHVPSSCIEQIEDIHLILEHMIVKSIKDTTEVPKVVNPFILSNHRNGDGFGENGREEQEYSLLTDGDLFEQMGASVELLHDLHTEINGTKGLPDLLQRVLEKIVLSLDVSSGSILLFDDKGAVFEAAIIYKGEVAQSPSKQINDVAQLGLAGWVAQNRQAAMVKSTTEDPRWLKRPWDEQEGAARSAISVPLIDSGRAAGVLTVVHNQAGWFSRGDLLLLSAVAVFVSTKAVRESSHRKV
jgi:D-sedoheptulose 7-phosphate isomerase